MPIRFVPLHLDFQLLWHTFQTIKPMDKFFSGGSVLKMRLIEEKSQTGCKRDLRDENLNKDTEPRKHP